MGFQQKGQELNLRRDNVRITSYCGAFTYCLYLLGCFNCLITFHSKGTLLWRFNLAGKSKTYFVLCVNWSTIFSILTTFGLSRQIFTEVLTIKSHRKPSRGRRAVTCRQTDGYELKFRLCTWKPPISKQPMTATQYLIGEKK